MIESMESPNAVPKMMSKISKGSRRPGFRSNLLRSYSSLATRGKTTRELVVRLVTLVPANFSWYTFRGVL